MKKRYKTFSSLVGIILAFSIISLSVQAKVCLRQNNGGALIRATYNGVTHEAPVYSNPSWDYAPNRYMLLEVNEFIGWGNDQQTPNLNDDDLVEITGTTTSYGYKVYPNQCAAMLGAPAKPKQ